MYDKKIQSLLVDNGVNGLSKHSTYFYIHKSFNNHYEFNIIFSINFLNLKRLFNIT